MDSTQKVMTDQLTKVLNGTNGQLEIYADKLIIRRQGFRSKMTQGLFAGDKTIYIADITSIKVKNGSMITNGFIQFALSGNLQHRRGLVAQAKDENTIFFTRNQNEEVNTIQQMLEQRRQDLQRGGPHVNSSADEIRQYKALLDEGLISTEEYETKKRQLLGM